MTCVELKIPTYSLVGFHTGHDVSGLGVDDAKKATARAAGDGVARPLRRRRRFLRRNRRAVASQRHQKPPGSRKSTSVAAAYLSWMRSHTSVRKGRPASRRLLKVVVAARRRRRTSSGEPLDKAA